MFSPDPEFQNIAMLYTPVWNGFVEGPTWDAWWIQNSYGPTYCALPFFEEPCLTFLQNSQDLWFDQMGDGKRVGFHDWVGPDGCLCDAARPGWIVYKQGDGRVDIHDWGMEFTAAGLLLQAELLLISRDSAAIDHYLPKLERCAGFIETRRDKEKNLFLAGPAGNLLAPSYAGWKKVDGTYGQAFLSGLSITYIAALGRLIELEKLAGHAEKTTLFTSRREAAKSGLKEITTDEGYFIKSLDPDGTRHGVFGADHFGYFESSPNHDAVAFRVVDEAQAERIYSKIASIPGLRPFDLIIPNYPGLDDMYTQPDDWLWKFGTWVNGGHWSTCEARMILAYYRLGKFEDARRSMRRMLDFARRFRLDNPLTNFGSEVYQPKQPINLCYDSLGPSAALIRGLFEYVYSAEGVRLYPHIPPGISDLEQLFPIRLGEKRLFLSTHGSGGISSVRVNGKDLASFDAKSVFISYDTVPETANIELILGGSLPGKVPSHGELSSIGEGEKQSVTTAIPEMTGEAKKVAEEVERIERFRANLVKGGLGGSYEAAHAAMATDSFRAYRERQALLAAGAIRKLDGESSVAADQCYLDSTARLCKGLSDLLSSNKPVKDAHQEQARKIWRETP
jgi:hypothetical protein